MPTLPNPIPDGNPSNAYTSAFHAVHAARTAALVHDDLSEADHLHAPNHWPLCGWCQRPVIAGPRRIAYPLPNRPAFILHGDCAEAVRQRVALALEAGHITTTDGLL